MNIKILIVFLLVASMGLSSCKSTGDIAPVVKTSNLVVVNATTDSLNFYQNGARLNQLSPLSPGGQSGYLTVPVTLPLTAEIYQFKKAGSADYLINNYKLTLDTSTYYSLFAGGETVDKLFLITDPAPSVTATQAALRVVDASPGTTNLTVTVGNVSFNNLAFKSASAFTGITGGITTVTVYQNGSATPLYTLPVNLFAGTIYTVFTKGVLGGTGQNQLSAVLMVN